jgi:TatD DNase family protein
VWACLGFHPDPRGVTEVDLVRVVERVRHHHGRIVGLGEVGLPWYSLEGASDAAAMMTRGRAALERMLALAVRYDLPVALHAPHGAAVGALEALKRHRIERAVFHWHKAPADVTRAIVDAGFLVSVGPEVVYRERDRELVEHVPIGSLLVESDAPWKYGGEFATLPSGPWLAGRVAEEVGKLKHMPVEDAMFELSGNACRLFDLVWT